MSGKTKYLYVIGFTVRDDSGIAIIVAYNEKEAAMILKQSGQYNHGRGRYDIEKTTCIGELCGCEYGLIMESYTNAIVAYEALLKVAEKIKGEKGDKGEDGGTTAESIEEALGFLPKKISINTTVGWNNAIGYVPEYGEIVIYSDYGHVERDGNIVSVAGIKIGSGNGYVQDLAFVGEEDEESLLAHINDNIIHVTSTDKTNWNNKLNVDDNNEVVNGALIFNRN